MQDEWTAALQDIYTAGAAPRNQVLLCTWQATDSYNPCTLMCRSMCTGNLACAPVDDVGKLLGVADPGGALAPAAAVQLLGSSPGPLDFVHVLVVERLHVVLQGWVQRCPSLCCHHPQQRKAGPAGLCSACCLRQRLAVALRWCAWQQLASTSWKTRTRRCLLAFVTSVSTGCQCQGATHVAESNTHHAGGRVFTHVDALRLQQRPHLLEGGDLRGRSRKQEVGTDASAMSTCNAVRLLSKAAL